MDIGLLKRRKRLPLCIVNHNGVDWPSLPRHDIGALDFVGELSQVSDGNIEALDGSIEGLASKIQALLRWNAFDSISIGIRCIRQFPLLVGVSIAAIV